MDREHPAIAVAPHFLGPSAQAVEIAEIALNCLDGRYARRRRAEQA